MAVKEKPINIFLPINKQLANYQRLITYFWGGNSYKERNGIYLDADNKIIENNFVWQNTFMTLVTIYVDLLGKKYVNTLQQKNKKI